jgi:1-acyl-sn-glycerol-3-phosphate acyltransferase
VAAANGRLAQHQRVASAAWWAGADFPRTALGKVRRHLLPAPAGAAAVRVEQPLRLYTWGRVRRILGLPIDLLYLVSVSRTVVLGREHLRDLPWWVILAGAHHSFAGVPLVRHGLLRTPARRLAWRLVVAAGARGFGSARWWASYGILAFGLYPLRMYGEREASLRGLARLAERGNAVLIFPQGVHARPAQESAGAPAVAFRAGVAHLAAALDAAVAPFGLAGAERMVPAFLEEFHGPIIAGIPVSVRRGPLAIAFGPPLRLEPGEAPPDFAARLQTVCYALTRQAEAASADGSLARPPGPPRAPEAGGRSRPGRRPRHRPSISPRIGRRPLSGAAVTAILIASDAGVTQLAECLLPKQDVEGSNPFTRSMTGSLAPPPGSFV